MNDSGWRKRQIALDEKAENASELGLDYEPKGTVMTKDEALKLALEALTFAYNGVEEEWLQDKIFAADTALRVVLAEAEKQEPVACKHEWFYTGTMEPGECRCIKCGAWNTTTPFAAQRTWVGLTDEDCSKIWRDVVKWGDPSHDDVDLMKAIEAKLKEKNFD